MAYETKAELKAAVKDWIAEQDLSGGVLDRAITLVEADIRRRLRVFQMEVTADFVISAETTVVPSRFLSLQRLYIPGRRPMTYVSGEDVAIALAREQVTVNDATPRFYSLEGVEDALPVIRVAPAPSASVTARITYTADPALISDTDCNAVLDQWPDIYHYGTLTHIGGYLGNEDRLPKWEKRYETALTDAQGADLADRVDGSSLAPTKVYRVA